MGNSDGRKYEYLKMGYTTWLTFLVAVITLTTPAHSESPRVVCYYTNWSVYRPGTAKFNPQNINPYLCTHLVYAFGGFTKDNTLKPFDKYQDIEKGGYAKFTGLKTYNKNLKTMLAIGGWNEGSSRFSPMVAAKDKRREFVRNAIKFLRQNHFDGLDLDWEYPAFRDGGKSKDRENYAKLVKELRGEFERESETTGKPRLLLTMAVPAGIEYILKGFDIKTLNRYLDWMNLLSYDYHSAFEPAVNHHAPLFALEEPNEYSVDNELNIDYTIKFYLEHGADPDKLVLGIPTYGRSYTLFNADAVEIGSPADGPGEQGEATREKGYLAYYEICEALKPKIRKRAIESEEEYESGSEEDSEEEEKEWSVMYPNKNAMGPVAYRGNQWVGYDDIDIVKKKAEYVAENGLGGIMFWSIDNDDFRGTCHGKPYPLIEAAKEAYISKLGTTTAVEKVSAKEKSKQSRTGGRRRSRPKSSTTTTTTTTTTTPKPIRANKRRDDISTTPAWNIITPEPPTTPDPGSDFKCKDEGFFPHPRDCKKYFWCLDSGPSDLGIVAHQFTCPSGLYFNKAADSCDFARNVLCKKPTATTKAITKPTTAKTTVTTTTPTTTTTTTTTTTRRPVRLTSRSSVLFRTTTTTTTTPEPESIEEDEEEDVETDEGSDVEAEDPRVIKELIDLIKKVGGVEQLEKQLKLSETPGAAATVTPASINTKLYQRVLERTRGKNKFSENTITKSGVQNSRRGPQNAGIEPSPDKNRLLRKERPQYVTINRSRPTTSPTTPLSAESEEEDEEEEESEEIPQLSRSRIQARTDVDATVGTTPKPLQYVNIRRSRPTTTPTEAPDDSRNALFERVEPYVAVESPNSLDIVSSRRETTPEYVTIRRARPTAETTTLKYQASEEEEEYQETALEREISSAQPQYTSVIRTRSTTLPPVEEPSTSEPTTILSVQISSLLNEPSSEEIENLRPESVSTQITELPEAETTTTSTTTIATTPTTTTTTTTSTTPPPTKLSTRAPLLRRRGSTTTTSSTAVPISSTQATRERRPFLRRTKATAPPEVTDSESPVETTTSKYRGTNRFKLRKTEKTNEKPRENETTTDKPSSTTAQTRNDRPRNFVRRRLGGANLTTLQPSSATQAPILPSRRPFRVASRRRLISSTTSTTTTAKMTAALIESEESLQDIGDTDAIEDPSLMSNTSPRTTTNAPRRRPLVQLKNDQDQSPSATNEEEKKRQSKKYSSSFKQNQLDDILKLRASSEDIDVTTEGKTTLEDISAETAVALAAHQLIAAPIPIIPDYDDEYNPTRKTPQTIVDYKFTSPEYTEDVTKTQTYTSDYSRTPAYTSRQRNTETSTASYTYLQSDTDTPSSTRSSDIRNTPYTSRFSRPIDSTNTINPTISGVTLSIGSEVSGESTARYLNFQNEINPSTYSTSNYESRVSKPALTTNFINPTTAGVSLNLRESTLKYTATNRDVPPTYPTLFTSKVSRPAGFSPNLVNIDEAEEVKSTVKYQGSSVRGPSTARYEGSSEKIPVPVVFGYSTGGQGLQEPSYFTREYLLESPVTKTYDDEYQYLSPVTEPQTTTTTRKPLRRKTVFRRISTTQSPTSVLPVTTERPRRTRKPFEKILVRKNSIVKDSVQRESVRKDTVQKKFVQKVPAQEVQKPNRPIKPIIDYDYYDASQEEVVHKYEDGPKVVLHAKGKIECLDRGNFPHPTSCKKFISCARLESGALIGWEYICPKGLSFDPVGGICNWSAGLGCFEKDT